MRFFLIYIGAGHSQLGVTAALIVSDLEALDDRVGQFNPGIPLLPIEETRDWSVSALEWNTCQPHLGCFGHGCVGVCGDGFFGQDKEHMALLGGGGGPFLVDGSGSPGCVSGCLDAGLAVSEVRGHSRGVDDEVSATEPEDIGNAGHL